MAPAVMTPAGQLFLSVLLSSITGGAACRRDLGVPTGHPEFFHGTRCHAARGAAFSLHTLVLAGPGRARLAGRLALYYFIICYNMLSHIILYIIVYIILYIILRCILRRIFLLLILLL